MRTLLILLLIVSCLPLVSEGEEKTGIQSIKEIVKHQGGDYNEIDVFRAIIELEARIEEIDDGLNGLGAIYYDLDRRIQKLEEADEKIPNQTPYITDGFGREYKSR